MNLKKFFRDILIHVIGKVERWNADRSTVHKFLFYSARHIS